ncbi:MAG: sodium:solute symporter family protein [Gemmatimonadales bacterium]|nr:sodium:solute symporter family protein [Gemmatimonadales bacterium]
MISLAGVAYAVFLLYAVLRLFRKPASGVADYIVAGRRLTLPAFTASLVTTWYGGILGVGEYTWTYGISNWLVFGLPYYLFAGVFALFLAGRARRSRMLTVPDLLEDRYGRSAALVGAGTIFLMTAPAAYVLMLGVLVAMATGWPLWAGVALGTALSVGYVFRGGLRAVVATDVVQFFLMFGSFLILVPVCVSKFGGWDFLRQNLPASHLAWDGGLGWQAIAVWYFIALSTLVEPAFYQRCYAAKSESTARRGIAAAIGLWIVFDFLTTTAGLYARVLLPDLADPMQAFPALAAEVLGPFWQGVFTVGLLATIMSTVDSYSFIGAVTLGRDIIGRWRGLGEAGSQEFGEAAGGSLTLIRWSLLATAILAATLALVAGSVITLWKTLGSLGTPVLLLPLALAHTRRRLPGRAVVLSMVASGCVSGIWLFWGRGGPWLGVEAIFPGLLTSILVLLVATKFPAGSVENSSD